MIKINVTVDLSKLIAKLDAAREQVPFATALALTRTAQNVQGALVDEMKSVFKAPSSFTLRSLTVTRAEKTALLATVGVRGADTGRGAIRWLAPEVFGGERSHAIEALLQPLGLPPNGLYAVPGASAKMAGSSGRIDINWFRSLVADIAAQGITQARGIVTRRIRGTGRKRAGVLQYAILLEKRGKLQPGIYGRRGRGIYPFVLFVRKPNYRARLDFFGVAQRVARETFPYEFRAAVAKAMATAR
jgi:hypothetical protein